MLQRAASNAYSWWWASHIRTRQSKWLDSNLQDMEDRVKCILLLLGEEADSFAKRAEMYYKRRPEVISSVEEAYRAYRALAERYDHMSGELHKANHTVATAFPDQVQYSMLEEDDDSLPKAFTAVDPRKIHKSTVEGLMNKKKGRKPGQKDGGKNCAAPVNKENAQKEISRMQKEILVLQTEKEFIKSSYESGIAKYWDLEKQINDMHEEVCYFQEEFNESAVIEDDEARALMTASALKSCEDAIARLREQQKLSFSQAMVELERASVSREKLKNIMKEHGKFLSDSGNSLYENVRNDATVKMDDLYSMKQEKIGIEAIVDKIKEYFQKDTDISVAEIAERIDDMVNKVVDLELMVSSQTAKIDRLCLENTELEISLQELEGEQAVVNSGSGELNDKLEKAEDELMRVQYLESSFHAEESIVYSNFAETASSFCCITDLLQSPPVEHQAGSAPRLTHEATPSADTASSGKCEKTEPEEDPQMDKPTTKPDMDGVPDSSGKLELATVSDNCHHDIKEERQYCADDLEDLWDCGLERKSSFADASVNKETAENVITGMLQTPLTEHQAGCVPTLADEATPPADTEPSGEYEKIKPEEDPLMDKATRKPDIDGLPDCSSKLELATVSDNSHQSNCYNDIKAERHDCTDDLEDLWDCGFERNSSFAVASVNKETAENAGSDTTDMLQSPLTEHQVGYVPTMTDEATPLADSKPSGKCEKIKPEEDNQMDNDTQKLDIDGFLDWCGKPEIAIISADSENLWQFELDGESSFAAASVDNGTAENADNSTSGEHNNAEVKYNHGAIGSNMQPYVVHSHEQGSVDRLHQSSPEAPWDHDLKQVDGKQDSSTVDHSIFGGHSEQDMNIEERLEDSHFTENFTPGNGKAVGVGDQENNMANMQQLHMSGLQDKKMVLLTECKEKESEEDPQMDKATRKPEIYEFPDFSSNLELVNSNDNRQPSNSYQEIMAEKHDSAGDSEDLWYCGLERKSSFAVATVNKEKAENIDNYTFGEHNNGISMQPYVVHSHEQGSLDRLHHISSEVPGDHHAKLEDDKQDSSTAGHSISKGHYEQEMKKAEESEDTHGTENSIPGSEIAVVVRDQEENMANLQKLLMSGLQDKEKVLLTEYTSILRNYKNAKRRLTEVEIKNQECLDEMKAMMSELRSANELKDKEIRSLRELLNTSTVKDAHQNGHQMNTYTSLSIKSGSFRGHRRIPSFLPGHQRRESASSISRIIMKNSSPKNKDDASHDAVFQAERIGMGDIRLTNILEMQNASPLEDKFRRDIDGLLEENLDFWMKFSTSFEKILELQTKHDQLQSEIGKRTNADRLKENSGGTSDPRAEAEPETIEKRLRELKIEMQVWLEQNAMFKGELQCRFASLCSIQEEIQAAMEMDAETVEGIQFTSYHAAKFQGEILSMKQENDKVADELQAGLDYIRGLQEEVEKILAKILKSTSLSGSKGSSPWRNAPSKSRVPLRSFLFPAKKKKPSLLACMNPALQKQYSDMAFFAKME
ncbi:protein NETWORKED 2A [Aegilops tauschii subsp. strangulata]|uniref:NAB domain-containing protein n=3 Tax=Aegilops tauschii TaxID=37682 RepID=A0A452XRE7_AEGTS|nr:protein NETWORKED 2C [Aegilops tauschii subsp. strangulata]